MISGKKANNLSGKAKMQSAKMTLKETEFKITF
jgi:hypothetical protein